MADPYERELKGILGGEDKFLVKAVKWAANYGILYDRPFLAVKAGGSFGIDLLATRLNVALPVEVKSSADRIFRFSKNAKLLPQMQRMVEACDRAMLPAYYAYRLKNADGDPWKMFIVGNIRHVHLPDVPTPELTLQKQLTLHWDHGLPLGKFLSLLP